MSDEPSPQHTLNLINVSQLNETEQDLNGHQNEQLAKRKNEKIN